MHEIAEFFVITSAGVCVFSKTDGREDTAKDLIAGFLNAITLMTKQMTADAIRSFSFGNHKLILYPKHDMQFVAKVNTHANEKAIWKRLEQFAKRFFELFPPEFMETQWGGNLGIFAKLDEPFTKLIADSLVRMQAAIW